MDEDGAIGMGRTDGALSALYDRRFTPDNRAETPIWALCYLLRVCMLRFVKAVSSASYGDQKVNLQVQTLCHVMHSRGLPNILLPNALLTRCQRGGVAMDVPSA